MTLYIVFDYLHKNRLSWNSQMKVSKIASSRSPSKLYLEEGSYITVENAVLALIIKSANDVAAVVAEHISKTEKEFAKLMTAYARNIGMKNTTFKNASGLPNRAQMTSARDIATLSHALISNFPEEYKLFSREKFVWKGKTYKSHNRLMKSYEGADGIKTGYIKASGFQLAFSAVREDKRLIGVYFGGDSGKHRDKTLAFLMDKEFGELNINAPSSSSTKIVKKEKANTKNYKVVNFKDSDALELENGEWIRINASTEKVIDINTKDNEHQSLLAWHLGNRHLAMQIINENTMRIEYDHVILDMLIGLNAKVNVIEDIFEPELGAYGSHNH
jgi:D-alanyl-D-alanine carboxypeptidase